MVMPMDASQQHYSEQLVASYLRSSLRLTNNTKCSHQVSQRGLSCLLLRHVAWVTQVQNGQLGASLLIILSSGPTSYQSSANQDGY